MLELRHIDKGFDVYGDRVTVFSDFSLSVARGEFLSIVGSNGSGKTTMLNLIAGTLFPDRGSVFLDGEEITKKKEHLRAARIGRVFQNPGAGVAEDMTVAENLALAMNKNGKRLDLSRALTPAKAEEYRALAASLGMGLEDRMNLPAKNLSGGQRQALTLLMATATPIDLLILDEHTAALDPAAAERIMELTDRIVREKELTAVMVTHNLRYAVTYGTRLLMMDKGKAVLDLAGEEKKKTTVADLLGIFNEISTECGN